MKHEPDQVIQVGDHLISLPPGVTAAEWGLERRRWQNPRIRAFLGCIRLLEGVLESNYAILHCSPERLRDIWAKVRKVSELLRDRVGPLLTSPSVIPELEVARRGAELSLAILEDQVLVRLDALPLDVPEARLLEVRKLLCVSIGQMHAYLQDTFGELMAADPRSLHDADYFLSRRFPRDIEEAEWLHATVRRLDDYLKSLVDECLPQLSAVATDLREPGELPGEEDWGQVRAALESLLEGLVPKLREVLALRGIRFDEMEVLDRYATDFPVHCRTLEALWESGREAVDRMARAVGSGEEERRQGAQDRRECQRALAKSMAATLDQVDSCLRDLQAFVPLWLGNIEQRRALMFRKKSDPQARAAGVSFA